VFGKEIDMRHSKGSPVIRRTAALAVIVAMVATLAAPALASAAAAPRPSARVSVRTMKIAKAMKISGSISRTAAGGTIQVQVRRPGSARWSYFGSAGINKRGRWAIGYQPRVPGRYYFRALYGVRASRVVNTRVRKANTSNVMLHSTTSTQDSGLFTVLIPAFEAKYPWLKVQVVAVGSGAAMQAGKDKNSDVLLVHSPTAEADFIAGNYGFNRRAVMSNDYVIVGPTADPLGVKASAPSSAVNAFKRIYDDPAVARDPGTFRPKFYSRFDDSGTHNKELSIWAKCGPPYNAIKKTTYTPLSAWPDWYNRSADGMGAVLTMTNEQLGYTLTDRATWLTRMPADLAIVTELDPLLYNPYSVIEVSGARNADGAGLFSEWITSPEAQLLIGRFKNPTGFKPIFVPNAI
jgi:tungstate transport system substrate-binding protein